MILTLSGAEVIRRGFDWGMLENLNAGWDCGSTLGLGGLLDLLAGPEGRFVPRALGDLSERVCGLFQRESRSSEDVRGLGLGSRVGAKMGKVLVCASFRAMKKKKKKKIKCFAFFNFLCAQEWSVFVRCDMAEQLQATSFWMFATSVLVSNMFSSQRFFFFKLLSALFWEVNSS